MSLIHPLKQFPQGIPKMEETSIFASLSIKKPRGRSIIVKEEEGTTVESVKGFKVNFLGFDEKNNQFTTNWSEVHGTHVSGEEGSKFEGFGMTNINIDVNTGYIPKVDISIVSKFALFDKRAF